MMAQHKKGRESLAPNPGQGLWRAYAPCTCGITYVGEHRQKKEAQKAARAKRDAHIRQENDKNS